MIIIRNISDGDEFHVFHSYLTPCICADFEISSFSFWQSFVGGSRITIVYAVKGTCVLVLMIIIKSDDPGSRSILWNFIRNNQFSNSLISYMNDSLLIFQYTMVDEINIKLILIGIDCDCTVSKWFRGGKRKSTNLIMENLSSLCIFPSSWFN